MPTGYTYPVIEGKVTTATEFAQLCARAFMGNMRESGMDAPLRMVERDPYYTAEKIAERLAELDKWDNSTEEDKYAAWSDYVEATEKRAAERQAEAKRNRERILPIYKAINQLDVPSTHQGFKDFMLEQLGMTITQDGTYEPRWYQSESYPEWCDAQRAVILRGVEIATEGMVSAEKRYQQSREWVSGLVKHFGVEVLGDPEV